MSVTKRVADLMGLSITEAGTRLRLSWGSPEDQHEAQRRLQAAALHLHREGLEILPVAIHNGYAILDVFEPTT